MPLLAFFAIIKEKGGVTMKIQRCPECGIRLNSNYCDICMRRVPFKGVPVKQTFQHAEGSSAHREEKHDCIDFGEAVKKQKPVREFHFPQKKTAPDANKKKGAVIGIVLAVLSVLTPLMGLVDEAIDSVEPAPEPEIYIQEGFIAAGDPGAENVPAIETGDLYNSNGIRITADAAGLSYGDYTVLLTIHNETQDDISVSSDLLSVNGYMLPFGFYHDVKAGRTAQTYLTFYEYELEKAGITEIALVEFVLDVYNSDSYEDIVTGKLLTLETEIAKDYEQPVSAYGWELYHDDSVSILIRDMQMDDYGDVEIELHMENLSDRDVSVYIEKAWINAEETSCFLWDRLRPDTRAVDSIHLYELEALDIKQWEQIQEITLELTVEYMDGWETLITVNEAITFNPHEIR